MTADIQSSDAELRAGLSGEIDTVLHGKSASERVEDPNDVEPQADGDADSAAGIEIPPATCGAGLELPLAPPLESVRIKRTPIQNEPDEIGRAENCQWPISIGERKGQACGEPLAKGSRDRCRKHKGKKPKVKLIKKDTADASPAGSPEREEHRYDGPAERGPSGLDPSGREEDLSTRVISEAYTQALYDGKAPAPPEDLTPAEVEKYEEKKASVEAVAERRKAFGEKLVAAVTDCVTKWGGICLEQAICTVGLDVKGLSDDINFMTKDPMFGEAVKECMYDIAREYKIEKQSPYTILGMMLGITVAGRAMYNATSVKSPPPMYGAPNLAAM
jgi:hypothetical protein